MRIALVVELSQHAIALGCISEVQPLHQHAPERGATNVGIGVGGSHQLAIEQPAVIGRPLADFALGLLPLLFDFPVDASSERSLVDLDERSPLLLREREGTVEIQKNAA